jgi:hypothetical protein
LPLANERSPAEIRKELLDTVEDLSNAVGLDDEASKTVWSELKISLTGLEAKDTDRKALWAGVEHRLGVAHKFYAFDAHIQDEIVLQASQAAAYQLGRGLAETFWALQPECAADAMGSWEFLLGPERCDILCRLALRMSAYVEPEVLVAIAGPLKCWAKLASETERRGGADIEECLYHQGLLWRDLVRGERSPADLQLTGNTKAPATATAWKDLKLYRTAAVSLRWPLIGGIASLVLLVAGAWLLATGTDHAGPSTAIGILGALGLTSAGLYAHAKANVTSLLSNLSQTVQIERIRWAANLCPNADASTPESTA